jgi:hypothetical protein
MFFVPGEILSCRATASFCIIVTGLLQRVQAKMLMLQANGVVE